jgi:8-oxo-dGTP pyrophosphatase MutT (NUDIX family)
MFPWRESKNEQKQVELDPAFTSLKRPTYMTTLNKNRITETKPAIYGAIIRSINGYYALVQGRSTGKWSFPKGHANPEESPFDCVCREIKEEIGCIKLPMPTTSMPLQVGYYYIYDVDSEFELKPQDTNEVGAAGWFTVDEIRKMSTNVDISHFIQRLK